MASTSHRSLRRLIYKAMRVLAAMIVRNANEALVFSCVLTVNGQEFGVEAFDRADA